jgi:hypothetical protein
MLSKLVNREDTKNFQTRDNSRGFIHRLWQQLDQTLRHLLMVWIAREAFLSEPLLSRIPRVLQSIVLEAMEVMLTCPRSKSTTLNEQLLARSTLKGTYLKETSEMCFNQVLRHI